MSNLMMGVQRFLREEEGTEVVEWALVGGLIVAVGAAIFGLIGGKVKIYLDNLNTSLGNPT